MNNSKYPDMYHTFHINSSCNLPNKGNILSNLQKNCSTNLTNNKEICILKILKDIKYKDKDGELKIIKIFNSYKCYLKNNHKDLSIQCAKQNKPYVLQWTIENGFMTPKYIYKCCEIVVKKKFTECLNIILFHATTKRITFKSAEDAHEVPEIEKFSLPKLRNILINNIITQLGLTINNTKTNSNKLNIIRNQKLEDYSSIIEIMNRYLPGR